MEVVLDQWILLIGAVTPFVTAVAAKINTPDWQKGLMSLLWAAVGAVLVQVGDTSLADLDWSVVGGDAAAIFSTHLLTWLGISSAAVQSLHERTASVGIRLPFS